MRIAIDIGGTFTDVVAETAVGVTSIKVLTDPARPEVPALEGVARLLAQVSRSPRDIAQVVHGTTLATNALIERRGAKTAFVTTAGFRDVLEMRNEKRFDQYALDIEFPAPLVPRALRLEVEERILADGTVLTAPKDADIDALATTLQAEEVEAVAIGFLHAYKNPAHEHAVADRLAHQLGNGVTICLSSEVAGEIREYERFSTVCANAYVRPLMSRYAGRLLSRLQDDGFDGAFYMMLSDGALTTLEQAIRFPIRLVEGGPAGGVALAAHVAREMNSQKMLSLDVGGTTAKICFIENGTPHTKRRFEIARAWRNVKGSGLPVRVPALEMVEIGAGGGSVAGIDRMGRLTVGPESAGSNPGPAAYGRGGDRPTITDAHLTVGNIAADGFAGGMITLDPARAPAAISAHVQSALDLTRPAPAAAGIIELADETMANAARVHGTELGLDIARFDLLVSGGGGALHAARIAEKLGIRRVIVPANAGVGSALGFLHAPIAFEIAISVVELLQDLDRDSLLERIRSTVAQAQSVVAAAIPADRIDTRIKAELRYFGQGLELALPLSETDMGSNDLAALQEAFATRYAQIAGFVLPNIPVELVSISVTARERRDVTHTPPHNATQRVDTGRQQHARHLRPRRWAMRDLPCRAARRADRRDTRRAGRPARSADNCSCAARLERPAGEPRPPRAGESGRMSSTLDMVTQNVLWNRLISVCEEQANALMRAAFGAIVREAGDLSAGVFNAEGAMLAQAVTGTPGHVNTMAASVRMMLDSVPCDTLCPGDALVTNDPWIGAGHIFDFVVVTPAFVQGRIVGYLAATSHIVDVGGRGWSAEAQSVFEEGVTIPVMRLRKGGLLNDDLLDIVTANSRIPHEARGDILSLLTCNDTGVARLLDLMEEYALTDLGAVSDFIFAHSAKGTREALLQAPKGTYQSHLALDGYDSPLDLCAKMTIGDGWIDVDLSGSSPAVDRGINCPLNYSAAYAAFGIRALLTPDVPNNQASLEAITIHAPPGLVVSATRPSPVTARHVIGQALPDLMFGCLEQALPGAVLAESAGALWTMSLSGAGTTPFASLNVALGGMGARPTSDGLSTTAFPSGVGAVPVEAAEVAAPVIYHSKEFAADTGGAGTLRGGLAQRIEIGARLDEDMSLSAAAFERLSTGPAGRQGGHSGAAGAVHITNGTQITDKGVYTIPAGERLILQTPGGGGFGDPSQRDRDAVARDLSEGLISQEAAATLYKTSKP
ncbi:MAG: hydantoinase B/oxoprolinase family protein [Pseudomonadota bacterium]